MGYFFGPLFCSANLFHDSTYYVLFLLNCISLITWLEKQLVPFNIQFRSRFSGTLVGAVFYGSEGVNVFSLFYKFRKILKFYRATVSIFTQIANCNGSNLQILGLLLLSLRAARWNACAEGGS